MPGEEGQAVAEEMLRRRRTRRLLPLGHADADRIEPILQRGVERISSVRAQQALRIHGGAGLREACRETVPHLAVGPYARRLVALAQGMHAREVVVGEEVRLAAELEQGPGEQLAPHQACGRLVCGVFLHLRQHQHPGAQVVAPGFEPGEAARQRGGQLVEGAHPPRLQPGAAAAHSALARDDMADLVGDHRRKLAGVERMRQRQADQQVGGDRADAELPWPLHDRGVDVARHVDASDRPRAGRIGERIRQRVELAHLGARDLHSGRARREAQQGRQRGPDRGDAAKHEEHPEQGLHRRAPTDRVPGGHGPHDRAAEQEQGRTGHGEQAGQRAAAQVAGEPVVTVIKVFGELDFTHGNTPTGIRVVSDCNESFMP